MGTYTKSSINRAARPRSERLREIGGTIVSTSTSVVGGNSYAPSGSSHTHANLDSLDLITVDEGYIYLTDTYTDETTGDEVTETVKASVGYADRAGANASGYTLDWFIPVEVNGSMTLKLNPIYVGLWAEGWISAGGVGTGGGGGGGGATYLSELDDVTLGTLSSGNLLSWNGTAWTNIAQSAITPDLSGYATQSWVNGRGFLTSESDPVFSASAASGITASDIANWNGKTSNTGTVTSVTLTSGTGVTVSNSGTAITTTGSRTISISSTYQTYISHGETAYGWGNHASEGYLKQHQTVTLTGGTNNGTLKLTTSAGTVDNIAVTGLGSLAYKSSLLASDIPDLSGRYLPKTGGELTGDLWLHTGSSNYGSKLWFGDKGSGSGYVYLYEDTDDHLRIHADKGLQLSTGNSYGIQVDNNLTLSSSRSFTLGNGVLTWDSTRGSWKLAGNLYATGFITAGGVNTQSGTLQVDENVVIAPGKTITFGGVLSYSSGWKLTTSFQATALLIGSGNSATNVGTTLSSLSSSIQDHEQRIAALER